MGPAMVTATLANCNFASPAMFTLIAEVRNEPTEAAKRKAPAQVEVRYLALSGHSNRNLECPLLGVKRTSPGGSLFREFSSGDDFNSGR